MITFSHLSKVNRERCEQSFHGLHEWTPTDWATAMAGEAGETCNEIKKLRRGFTPQAFFDINLDPKCIAVQKIAKEIADVVIYADLLAQRLGLDLGEIVKAKFNEVSDRVGSKIKIGTGCAACDRGDFQLGHSEDCPNTPIL